VIRSYRGHELYNQNINPEVETKYGFPHLLIHRADLRYVLHEKAIGLGVDVKFDAHVKFIHIKPTVDRPTVLLDNGKEYQADLILGADGEHSVCRESLLQRHDPPLSSGDLVFRIAIPTHRIAMDPRLNHLIEPPGVHAWYGPNSHAVTYQLRKNDIFNIVLTVADPGAATIGAQPEEMNVLLKHCQTWDPLFLGLLKLSDKVLKWTLLQTNHLDQWMHPSGKLILIGDSAHATLPYLYVFHNIPPVCLIYSELGS
jgi:salicylate hydroxylase